MSRTVRFGDVVHKVNRKVDPVQAGLQRFVAGEHMDSGEPRVTRFGVVGDGYLGPAFQMHFHPGHILYGSRRTYLRKVAMADFEGVCANTTFVLEPSTPDLDAMYLLYVMSTERFHENSIGLSKGSVNPYINFSDIAPYEFELPSLDEQARAVELLSAIDEHILLSNQKQTRARKLVISSIFEKMMIAPSSSRLVRVCDLLEKSIGGIWGLDEGESEVNVRVIRSTEFRADGNINFDSAALRSVTNSQLASRELQVGDILLEKSGGGPLQPVGRVVFLPDAVGEKFVCSNFVQLLRADSSSVLPDYLFRILWHRHLTGKTIDFQKQTTGIRNLQVQDYLGEAVPIPPIEAQKLILLEVTAVEKAAAAALDAIGSAKALRMSLLNDEVK